MRNRASEWDHASHNFLRKKNLLLLPGVPPLEVSAWKKQAVGTWPGLFGLKPERQAQPTTNNK